MNSLQREAIRYANSMSYFAGKDKRFIYGQWRQWFNDCAQQEKLLDPKPYKVQHKDRGKP